LIVLIRSTKKKCFSSSISSADKNTTKDFAYVGNKQVIYALTYFNLMLLALITSSNILEKKNLKEI